MTSETSRQIVKSIREIVGELQLYLEKLEKTLNKNLPAVLAEKPLNWELDKLPWRKYKTGNAEWVYINMEDTTIKKLKELVEKSGGKLKLYNHVYMLSGDGRFIKRYPEK